MKGLLFSLGALCFYTVFNLIFAKRLSALSPMVAVPVYTGVMFAVSSTVAILEWKQTLEIMPTGEQYLWLIICGICVFAADTCYVKALNSGGTLAQVTTVICLLPLTSAAANAALTQSMPSWRQMAAMAMAVAAVILVANE